MAISIVKRGGWELRYRKEEKGELASEHCNENGLEMTSESLSERKESKGLKLSVYIKVFVIQWRRKTRLIVQRTVV